MNIRSFQHMIDEWMCRCFGRAIAADKTERNYRFYEEATELVQSLGMTREDCYKLVDYVFDRPVGIAQQEVGGVMVTLTALCLASHLDLETAAIMEAERIHLPEVMEKIRQKQLTKPMRSPLPGAGVCTDAVQYSSLAEGPVVKDGVIVGFHYTSREKAKRDLTTLVCTTPNGTEDESQFKARMGLDKPESRWNVFPFTEPNNDG